MSIPQVHFYKFTVYLLSERPMLLLRKREDMLDINANLYLAPLTVAHGAALFSLVDSNRMFLATWLPWVPFSRTLQHSVDFIHTTQKQMELKQGFHGGIFFHGQLVGVLGFHAISRTHKHASIGYWLGEPFTGKGLMTRAVKRLVRHAFVDEDLHRIEIRCAVKNRSSVAIPKRLGFQKEGLLRQCEKVNGVYHDHEIYALLRGDWIRMNCSELASAGSHVLAK